MRQNKTDKGKEGRIRTNTIEVKGILLKDVIRYKEQKRCHNARGSKGRKTRKLKNRKASSIKKQKYF